jgi:Na+/H+-dicarboxylate symporter
MQEDMTDVALSERVNRPRWRLSLSTSILLGVVAGIAAGILFGEYMAPLAMVGNGFVKLLQMTILPYIFVSLIAGIGSLTFDKAKTLTAKAGLVLLLYWVISFVFVLLMPLAFPEWESASFFSSALVEPPKPVDFLDLYNIPANPFKALSNNLVPAVVLFSISVGVALIGIRDKEPLLAQLRTLSEALVKIAGFVVKLTPLGVFAIAASAAGTMTVDEISKLQVYLITFTVASLILAFWVLPMLVAVATPFRYRDIVGVSRDALVTAFTTGNLFVVLTVLTEASKALFGRYQIKSEDTDAYVDIIIPVSFNFPNAGKLIMLLFVLFAGWFVGSDIGWGEYPQFVISRPQHHDEIMGL